MNAKTDTAKNRPQVGGRTISALAYVVAEIRGATGAAPWQAEGVAPALVEALGNHRCTDLATLARAAIRAAQDPAIRTPAPIALDGRHWHQPTTTEPTRPPKPARCSACHLELVGGETRETHTCRQRIDRTSPARREALEAMRTAAAQAAAEHTRAAAAAKAGEHQQAP